MAPVNKGKVLFTCREETCGKKFTDRSNRDRHEKRFNHKPLQRKSKEPLFDDTTKKYYCASPGCPSTSKFKGNIKQDRTGTLIMTPVFINHSFAIKKVFCCFVSRTLLLYSKHLFIYYKHVIFRKYILSCKYEKTKFIIPSSEMLLIHTQQLLSKPF